MKRRDRAPLRAPTVASARQAAARIQSKVLRTPLVRLNWAPAGAAGAGDDDVQIWLKLEQLQRIGSFKVRPASNAMAALAARLDGGMDAVRARGVCTASAGNFGQGLAWAASEENVPCCIVAPDTVPATKLAACEAYPGTAVVQVPYADWWTVIETHQAPQAPAGALFVHPGAESACLEGNATIALEIVEDLPDVDAILVPYGSGSICTGIACVAKELRPGGACAVLACEPATAAPFALSKQRGAPSRFDAWAPSFVDGCGGKAVLEEVWAVAKDAVDGGLAVPLDSIARAIRVLCERNRVVAEGAGACPVAAAMDELERRARADGGGGGAASPSPLAGKRRIACVVSGGGLDTSKLIKILQGGCPGDGKASKTAGAAPPAPDD